MEPSADTGRVGAFYIAAPAMVVGVLLGGVATWALMSNQKSAFEPAPAPDPVSVTGGNVSLQPGWRLYENREIGVAFEYPETWGTIRVEKEAGCFEAKEEMATSGDPCEQVRLSFEAVPAGIFFATETFLHEKYPIGRGAFFGDEYVSSEESLLGYCTGKKAGNPCTTTINSHGVLMTKSFGVLGMDDETGWKYLMRSPHPYFSSVVLASSRLNPAWQSDFDRLVDSLRFI